MRGKAPLRTRLLIMAALCPIIGGIVMGISWKEWQTHSHLQKNGTRTTGTVERAERRTSKRSSSYDLYVTYSAENRPLSKKFIAKRAVADEHPPGSSVEIAYDPKDPTNALLAKSLNPGEKRLLILLGVIFIVASPILGFFGIRMSPTR